MATGRMLDLGLEEGDIEEFLMIVGQALKITCEASEKFSIKHYSSTHRLINAPSYWLEVRDFNHFCF